MDFCGGTSSAPVYCRDDFNNQGAYDQNNIPFTGFCLNIPRPLRGGNGTTTAPPGACHTALGWFGARVPESYADPFFLSDYTAPATGSRFLYNDLLLNPTSTSAARDAAGAGGYVWAPTNANNAAVGSCPAIVNQGLGAVSTETHSVTFASVPVNGCGFKHGLPLDTDKNMGMLVGIQFYPFNEYIVRVYWSATNVAEPFNLTSLEYLGCIDHISPSGQNCINATYDVVARNSLYLIKPFQGNGLIQVNIVRDGTLQPALQPRGELYFFFDAVGSPSDPPSIDSVMFMYLNLYWAVNDCRYLQQCFMDSTYSVTGITQATPYATAVLPSGFDNPCGYDGDPCTGSVCNGTSGACVNEGYTNALVNAPPCTRCDPDGFVVNNYACKGQAFAPEIVPLTPLITYPSYLSLFSNNWDSYGKLEFCNTRTVERGDNTFLSAGRISGGVIQWVWYSGLSGNIADIQYMNGLSVSRLIPLSPVLYPNGASLRIAYFSKCASFLVQMTKVGFPPTNIFCSHTLSASPGSNDATSNCYTNSPNPYYTTEVFASEVTIDISSFIDDDYYVTIAVDNDYAQIVAQLPACATVNDPYLQLIEMQVIPSPPACDTGDDCFPGGICSGTVCTAPSIVCDTPTCAIGSCSAGTCSYTYANPSAVCNDNDACTTDTCTAGGCTNTPITCPPPVVCKLSPCDPVNGCYTSNAPDGTGCPAGSCEGGVCVIPSGCTSNLDCLYLADSCTFASCSAGSCTTVPVVGPCTLPDQCQLNPTCQPTMAGNRGVCVAASSVTCNAAMDFPADQLPCLENYACDSGTGQCTPTWFAAGVVCDEGDACKINGVCDSSHHCIATDFPCPASDPCNTFTCSGGVCTNTPVPTSNNQPCVPDHLACTLQGHCKQILPDLSICDVTLDDIQCPIPPITLAEYKCLDGLTCQVQGMTCTITYMFAPDGVPCSLGGDLCNMPGQCVSSQCEASPNTCSSVTTPCMQGTCNENTGQCTTTPVTNQPCDPTDLCSTDGMCELDPNNSNQADCVGTPVVCAPPANIDNLVCVSSYGCQSDSGLCGIELLTDGTTCTSTDLCLQSTTCQSGVCLGTEENCNVPGTIGLCDQGPGPVFTCDMGSCESPTPESCDDGLFCNGPEIILVNGVCQSDVGVIPVLPPPTNCTATYCDEATDQYVTAVYSPLVNQPCDTLIFGPCALNRWQCNSSGLFCHIVYTPVAEICGDGIDNNCNGRTDEGCSGHACTCLADCPKFRCYNVNCVAVPVVSSSSSSSSSSSDDDDDDDDDTFHGECHYTPIANGTPCTVADPCISSPVCNGIGDCIGTQLECSDSDPLTVDTCVHGVCVHTIEPHTPCDDGDACTVNDMYNSQQQCAGTPIVCHVCNQCATISCVGGACIVANKPLGTACDDGNACTSDDQCDGNGGCVGTEIDCMAQVNLGECDIALCDPGLGCIAQYAPFGGPCNTGIDALDVLEGASTSTCINGQCKVRDALLSDPGSPGCGGDVLTCDTPDQCEAIMSNFLQLLCEQSLQLAACSHTVYNDTTHNGVLGQFSYDDSSTVVGIVVNTTYAFATVKEWMELVHAELAAVRYCPDTGDCESFLTVMRRLRAVYDILLGLNLAFDCPALIEYGIHAVARQPKDTRWWMLMAWDDSLDMSTPADYDMNDLLVRWHVTEGLDVNGRAVLSEVRYEIAGRGSEFNHNLRWFVRGVPCSPTTLIYSHHHGFAGQFAHVMAYKWTYHPVLGTIDPGVQNPYNGCAIDVFHNTQGLMPAATNSTLFANTLQYAARVFPHRNTHLIVSVNYGNHEVDADTEPFDGFDFLARYDHALDVIGKGDVGTMLVNEDVPTAPVVLNSLDSRRMGYPMMQNLPCPWKWPIEEAGVFDAYASFISYANWLQFGGPPPSPPWYDVPSNVTLLFVP